MRFFQSGSHRRNRDSGLIGAHQEPLGTLAAGSISGAAPVALLETAGDNCAAVNLAMVQGRPILFGFIRTLVLACMALPVGAAQGEEKAIPTPGRSKSDAVGATQERAAAERFARGVAAEPGSFRPHEQYGEFLLSGMLRAAQAGTTPAAEQIEQARELFRHGLALAPTRARLHADLGRTWLVAGDEDMAPGVAALEHALDLAPRDRDIALDLAQLYGRRGQPERGRELIERFAAEHADAAWVGHAREALAWQVLDRARRFVDAGRHADALGILDEVTAAADARVIARFGDFIARLRAVVLYNIALERVNAGDIGSAFDMLERVIAAGVGDDAMLRAARELREKIRPSVERARGGAVIIVPPHAPRR